MALALDVASWILLVTGAVFALIGAVGLHRMPDVYTRMHAAGVTDTGGAILMLTGLLCQAPDFPVAIRLVLILIFLLLAGPAATHALAKAAHQDGIKPVLADDPQD